MYVCECEGARGGMARKWTRRDVFITYLHLPKYFEKNMHPIILPQDTDK